MIGRLRGELANIGINGIVMDVGGVGYDVSISLQTQNALPDEGQEVTLHIHTHVREDTLQLFGFGTLEERELFRLLIGVSGIGPRMGINVLSHINPGDFADTVKRENLKRLTAIPGIGKRTAERVVLELRDKLMDMELGLSPSEAEQSQASKAAMKDLHSALINFGYRSAEVDKVVAELEAEFQADTSLQEMVVLGLQKLSKQ